MNSRLRTNPNLHSHENPIFRRDNHHLRRSHQHNHLRIQPSYNPEIHSVPHHYRRHKDPSGCVSPIPG